MVPIPLIQTLEPRKGYWVNNNEWGDSFRGSLPNAVGAEQGIARLPNAPGPPRVYTVHLFRSDKVDPISAAYNADVYAKVTYGVGGIQNSFLCDWIHGAQVSLLASFVNVDFRTFQPLEKVPPLAYSVSGLRIILGAAFGSGTPTGAVPITYSETTYDELTLAARSFAIPDFARRVTVRVIDSTNGLTPGTASLVVLDCLVSTGNALATVDCAAFYGPLANTGLQLPGGTQFITITNGAAGTRRISVTWYLSL